MLRTRVRTAVLPVLTAALVALPASVTAIAASTPPSTTAPPTTAADRSAALAWHACPGVPGFQCASMRAPLDYAHPGRASVHLAMIRHRATDPAHRIGSLFFNPGGPGAPGTLYLPAVYSMFPPRVQARFDVVSFDPRGIGASTPAMQCFATPAAEQRYLAGLPPVAPVTKAQRRTWIRRYAGLDAHCARTVGPLLDHDSTADVARDMDRMRAAVGDPTMNYLGISYGSFLGSTYANLFPNRVRAMVLDGNLDPVANQRVSRVLPVYMRTHLDLAASSTIAAFLRLCGRAGPRSCAFAAGSVPATRAKYHTLLRRLRAHPATVGGVAYNDVLAATTASEYLYAVQPIPAIGFGGWIGVGHLLQQLWRGRGNYPAFGDPYEDPTLGVVCSESPEPRDPAAYQRATEIGLRRAGEGAYQWTWPFEACAKWPGHAAQPYDGPWNRRTAHPLLLIGNTVDAATPYDQSVALQRELADARLLTVEGYGHTSLINRSTCALTYEDRYFVHNRLPAAGTRCPQDAPPFP